MIKQFHKWNPNKYSHSGSKWTFGVIGNGGVLYIPQSSKTGSSLSDGLGESAEMQSAHSTTPVNWAEFLNRIKLI